MENEIKQIAEILGDSSSLVIAKYTRWYFINAVVWTAFWLVLLITAIRVDLAKLFPEADRDVLPGVRVVLVFVFALAVAFCVTNIFAADAYAIHALIKDIKP